MLTHMRQDVAIRALPDWLVFGPFLTSSLATLIVIYGSMLHDFGLLSVAVLESWPLWLPWLPPASFLAYAQWQRRASDLDLALPLPARRLWLAHGLSLGLGAAAILMLSASLIALFADAHNPGTGLEMIAPALRLLAGLAIAVAVLESREPALVRLTPSLANGLLVAAVLSAVPVLVLRLDDRWVLVLLGLALALGIRTWRSLPAALTLAARPDAARPDAARPDAARPDAARPEVARPDAAWHDGIDTKRTLPPWSVAPGHGNMFSRIQSASRGHRLLLYVLLYPTLTLFGLVSSAIVLWGHGEGAMFSVPLLTVFLLMLVARMTSSQLAMLDPLPVSRRLVFAAMVIPAFAAWLLGCGTAVVLMAGDPRVAARELAEGLIPGQVILAIVLMLTGLLWFCLIALSLSSPRRGASANSPNRRGTSGMMHFYALIAALVALELVLGFAIRLGWLAPEAPAAFIRRMAATLPDGGIALALLCALLLGTGYALAEAWFRRVEVVPRRGEPETLGGV